MMLSLIECSDAGPWFSFTFYTDEWGDEVWRHAAFKEPLVAWYDSILFPLARARGQELTPDEVSRSVHDAAAAARVHPTAIDWLGLALYAAERLRLACGKLVVTDALPEREAAGAAERVARILERLYERYASRIAASADSTQAA
jgi:hypothetical protein